MQDFRNLHVWQKAHVVALSIYQTTRAFPREEQFGLTSQMRRAAVSIAANIAEGCGRGSDRDFARMLQLSLGSASELEYYVLLGRDLGLLARSRADELEGPVIEIKRMLAGLISKLTKRGRSSVGHSES